jgi:hypothetical protein
MELTKKNQDFLWIDVATKAFEGLKEAFTIAPILVTFDLAK